jgi:hypothetical protein
MWSRSAKSRPPSGSGRYRRAAPYRGPLLILQWHLLGWMSCMRACRAGSFGLAPGNGGHLLSEHVRHGKTAPVVRLLSSRVNELS